MKKFIVSIVAFLLLFVALNTSHSEIFEEAPAPLPIAPEIPPIGDTSEKYRAEKEKYYRQLLEWAQNEAKKGNDAGGYANDTLGDLFYNGTGVKQDYKEAEKWYLKAAEIGNGNAQHTLGIMCFYGKGIKQDYYSASQWFFKSAIQSKANLLTQMSQLYLGYLYSNGFGVSKNITESTKWYEKAIEIEINKKIKPLYSLFERLLFKENHEIAVGVNKYFAEKGNIEAQKTLGKMYREGIITSKDNTEAAKWYRMAGLGGDEDAILALCSIYMFAQNFSEAFIWCGKGAAAGDESAQDSLGSMYEAGTGVKQNYYVAADWYKKSANKGYMFAQYNLGLLYANGQGVTKNYTEANSLFRKAALQGYQASQYALGVSYYNAQGVERDLIQSLAWITLASTYDKEAVKLRDEIEKELKPNDVVRAQQLALTFEADIVKTAQPKHQSTNIIETADPTSIMLPAINPPSHTTPAFSPNDIAIIIGIEKYRTVPPTEYAAADAGMVRDYLKALGILERNIEFLADDRATLSDIRKVIETKLPNMAKANSRVIVYYAGHGAPGTIKGESYLVPYDGDPSFLADTAYPLSRLYDRLSRLKAKEVLVILDSCFSGAGGRSVLAKNTRPLVMVKETPLPTSKKMIVLTSSRGSQITTSLSEVGHGAFTYFFLRALQEGNRDIGEVYAYLNPRVTEEAKRQNVDQTPTISPAADKLKGRFLFAK